MLKAKTSMEDQTNQDQSLSQNQQSDTFVARKLNNIPEIKIRKKLTEEVETENIVQTMLDMDTETKQPKEKKVKAKRDEHGKRLLTPNQQFILQLNGWVGQLQQAMFMMSQIKDSGKQTLIEECQQRIEKFQTLVNIKLEEAKLIGFPLEFYEGSGRYRGLDKNFELPEIAHGVIEDIIQERVTAYFSERMSKTAQAISTTRQKLSTLSIQGKFQTQEFQQHLASVAKLELEEDLLRDLSIAITSVIHSAYSVEE